MNKSLFLAEILKEYFQNSSDQLAIAVRKYFAGLEKPNLYTNYETPLENWIDNHDVMYALHISPRTLQTLRSNGTLPFSRIGNKLYYRKQDIVKILAANYTMYKSDLNDEE